MFFETFLLYKNRRKIIRKNLSLLQLSYGNFNPLEMKRKESRKKNVQLWQININLSEL